MAGILSVSGVAVVAAAFALFSPENSKTAEASGNSPSRTLSPFRNEKCYGIAAPGQNDCATETHACAGRATKSRDKDSFVILPNGLCAKIEGGIGESNKG